MKKKRPVYLNLLAIKQPITAIISILHRASGAVLFLLIPFLLWTLAVSLNSPTAFDNLHTTLANPILKFIVWISLAALIYHLLAGIRHLLMDIGLGESLVAARFSAKAVAILALIFIVLAGVWLW